MEFYNEEIHDSSSQNIIRVMRKAGNVWRRTEMQCSGGENLQKKDTLERLDLVGRITLKIILNKSG